MGKDNSTPKADPLIGQAAMRSAQLGEDALNWFQSQVAANKPFVDESNQLSLSQARMQNDLSQRQIERGDEAYGNYMENFRPIEDRIAKEAMEYDTPERRSAAAGAAMADVSQALEAGKAAQVRSQQRMGVNPNSGKAMALSNTLTLGSAAAKANAANQGRKEVETMGAARLADAANLGRGISSSNVAQTQLGLAAGNSAINAANNPLNTSAQQAGLMNSGYGTAMQGNNSAGQLSLGSYQARVAAQPDNSALYGALGSVAGAGLLALSDKKQKKNIRRANNKKAMEAVRETPVSLWNYRKDSPADDGEQEHIGPMAQDVSLSMGRKAAPGGKVIDLVNMNGITLAAVKDLDRRVARLEDKRVAA